MLLFMCFKWYQANTSNHKGFRIGNFIDVGVVSLELDLKKFRFFIRVSNHVTL